MSEKLRGSEPINSLLDDKVRQEIIFGLMRGQDIDASVMYKWENEDTPEINGHRAYEQFCTNPMYQEMVVEPELRLLEKHENFIGMLLWKKTTQQIWDRGPGNEKAGKFSDIYYPEGLTKKLEYLPVDRSEPACLEAQEEMRKRGYKITKKHVDSFFGTEMSAEARGPLHLCLGLTAGNFGGLDKIVSEMRSQDKTIHPKVIMSYGVAPDPENQDYEETVLKLKAAYGDPDIENPYYCQEAHDAMWFLLSRTFEGLGIDTSVLELCVEYSDGEGVKFGLGVKEGEELRVVEDGTTFIRTHQDGPMWWECSERIPKSMAEQQLQESGQVAGDYFISDKEAGVGLLVFEKPNALPAMWEKYKKKAKMALWGTLIVTAGLVGKSMWTNYSYTKKVEEKVLDNMKYKFDGKTGQVEFGGETLDLRSDEGKLLLVEGIAADLYEALVIRYKDFNFPDDKEVLNALKLTLTKGDNLKYFVDVNTRPGVDLLAENKVYFIDHVFWPDYITMSAEIENTQVYEHLQEHEELMLSTRCLEDDVSLKHNDNIEIASRGYYKKYQGIDDLGSYVTAEGFTYKIASVSRADQQDYFMAYRYFDEDEGGKFNTEDGKIVINDYFKKGYADQLAAKVLDVLPSRVDVTWDKEDDPRQEYSHRYNKFGGPFETPITALSSLFVEFNMQGYDLSFLIEEGTESMIERLVEEFLPRYYSSLPEDKRSKLQNYFQIDVESEPTIAIALENLSTFLDTYYYSSGKSRDGHEQNLQGLQRELLREMLQAEHVDYTKLDADDWYFEYLYERRDLCEQYGFDLNTWKDFGNFEESFERLVLLDGDQSLHGDRVDTDIRFMYFNNFYRTRDGRVFSVKSSGRLAEALEITSMNNHLALEGRGVPLETFIAHRQEGLWKVDGDEYKQVTSEALPVIQSELNYTTDAAYEVAKDYIIQREMSSFASNIVAKIHDMYSCNDMSKYDMRDMYLGDQERYTAVTRRVEEALLKIWVASMKHSTDIENSLFALIRESMGEGPGVSFIDMFVVPQIKDELSVYFDMSRNVDYGFDVSDVVDQKSVLEHVMYFEKTFRGKDWNEEETERSILENKEVFEGLGTEGFYKMFFEPVYVYFLDHHKELSSNPTDIDMYKFIMEHSADFKEMGVNFIGVDWLREHRNIYPFIQNTRTSEDATWSDRYKLDYSGNEVILPNGEKYMLRYPLHNPGKNGVLYAKRMYSAREMEELREIYGKEYQKKVAGSGMISGMREDYINGKVRKLQSNRQSALAKKFLNVVAEVWGEQIFVEEEGDTNELEYWHPDIGF